MGLLHEFFQTNPNSSSCFNLSDLLDYVLNAPQEMLPEMDKKIAAPKIPNNFKSSEIMDFADKFINKHLRHLCLRAELTGKLRIRYFLSKKVSPENPLFHLDFLTVPKWYTGEVSSIYCTPFMRFLECFNIMNQGNPMSVVPKFSPSIGQHYFSFLTSMGVIRIWFVSLRQFGIAQLLTTSSKRHIDRLSQQARKQNAVLMPSGLCTADHRIISYSEAEIYEALSLPYFLPETRFFNLKDNRE